MEEERKKAFLIYYDYEENLEVLSDEQLGRLLRAIFKYEKLGLEPENLGSLELMAFNFIKGNLNRDRTKYDKRSKTSAENGKKGGRPRKPKPNEKPIEKPKEPKKADIDIVIDTDIDIVNEIDTVYDFIESEFGRTLSPTEYEIVSTWKDDELTKYAIKQAVLNGAYSIKYISRILENYNKKNIKSVQQAKEDEQKFQSAKEKNSRTIESKTDWQDKKIEENKASDEEIKELEERIKRR